MTLPWQTFLAKDGVKEVCFLLILAEWMLKNTTRYLVLQQKVCSAVSKAIFKCACAIGYRPLNVCWISSMSNLAHEGHIDLHACLPWQSRCHIVQGHWNGRESKNNYWSVRRFQLKPMKPPLESPLMNNYLIMFVRNNCNIVQRNRILSACEAVTYNIKF